jgi:predicted ATP-grasp superfamily ATP-dependent carboligase
VVTVDSPEIRPGAAVLRRARPPRVLVTEVQERSGLAAVRALAAAGFTVAGAASSRPAQGHWSRYCGERFTLPDPRADIDAYAEQLGCVLRRPFDVVMPATDASLIAISERREQLGDPVRLGLPSKEIVRRALDKVSLLDAASEAGLAPPPSVVCSDRAAVRRALRDLGLPALVKPHGSAVADGSGLRSQRGIVIRDDADVDRAVDVIASPLVAQRYVTGRGIISCAGVVAEGRMLAFCASRYLRTWPPDAGAASFAETIEPPDGLMDKVKDLLVRVGWQGVFELELLTHQGDMHAIDLNPRLHGWLALAVRAGANLPAVWCDWVTGRESPFVAARAGVPYRWEDGELLNAVRHLSGGRVGPAASCLRPHRNTAHAASALRDPLPLVARAVWVAIRLPGWIGWHRGEGMAADHARSNPAQSATHAKGT